MLFCNIARTYDPQSNIRYGKAPIYKIDRSFESNQWFSQVRQDLVVSRLLKGKRKGYFVDLASNDAHVRREDLDHLTLHVSADELELLLALL